MVLACPAARLECLTRGVGASRLFGPNAPAVFRVGTAAVIGVFAAVATGTAVRWQYAPAAGWIVAAAIYVAWTWVLIAHMDAEHTRNHACRAHEEDATRRWSHTLVVVASIASVAGVGYLLMAESTKGGDVAAAVVGVLSLAASWFAVHTVFTLRYARVHYADPAKGIDFHDGADPTYADFAYVAFTVGMTYQVSDTDLKGRRIRSTALGQAMLSFLLGAIILAVTINLVAGLAGYNK